MSQDLHFLGVAEAARLIARRALSPVELTEALLRRIDALDDQLDSFLTVVADRAMDAARSAEAEIARGAYRGPLHGIPFALKDVYETAGIRTTAHSKILIDHVPAADATVVQRLYAAGAVLLGKLATHEFASGGPSLDLPWPPARNPWNTAHFTGGSSSGAGAAVAAGLAPFALGTDTGGSIRIPAALCGLAGIKPTYGRVSRHGVIPNSFSFDHCGPLAWTAEDCAIVLQAIAGHDPRDPSSASRPVPDYRAALSGELRGLRVGVPRHLWEEESAPAPATLAALETAIEVLRSLGAEIGEARMRSRREYNDVRSAISRSELLAIYDRALRERPGDFSEDFIARNLAACLYRGIDVMRAQRERRRMLDELKPLYRRFDVLVTPTTAPAPRLDALLGSGFAEKWENPNIYAPFSLTGAPAMVVCNGFSADGLPLGMQIAGRPFDEATVLRVGHAYEQATGWRVRRPALTPGTTKSALHPPADPPVDPPVATDIDAAAAALLDAALERAGYRVTNRQRRMLHRVAPQILASAGRIPRDQAHGDEPAALFRFDPD